MYHPYLRGKQYELILLRENAKLIKDASMVPIIEPVKENLTSLSKAINKLKEHSASFVLVINPSEGDFKNNPLPIEENIINDILSDYDNYCIGCIVNANSSLIYIESFLNKFMDKTIAFIHNGYPKEKELAALVNQFDNVKKHIFIDEEILYRRAFKKEGVERVLLKDGFKRNRNKDYPDDEKFSELHLTYTEMDLQGFGDFLIVGNEYSESGGPAYAVAIHLTYINEDEKMNICHFKSDTNETPSDPAGKFAEALYKMVERVDNDDQIYKSNAYAIYKKFYNEGHFPGLGYVKKLSMQHHIEVLADFLSRQ
ncbi:sce7725 family protein [Sulfurovum sp. TSL1]|uniref:sce7725 family protein n=1 Tax=Sulfurovum sp. TSL1 TaxID=2826994 RepID=UPI001CC60527|nr:sce7725 family protein [Sulfurovum sp. TSL1]GIT98515.1 hypothetical protein TSL1_13360 [Sulfurovum sp. TSL1]